MSDDLDGAYRAAEHAGAAGANGNGGHDGIHFDRQQRAAFRVRGHDRQAERFEAAYLGFGGGIPTHQPKMLPRSKLG
ncbi:MAG: hypothetical protein E5X43_19510 [Mesorhizobium sp.]|nr:MAG: hypothetical protein E5X43_19510 [Mesorhizobium sp.]